MESSPEEAELVERAKRGSASAFEALLRMHQTVAYRTAFVGNEARNWRRGSVRRLALVQRSAEVGRALAAPSAEVVVAAAKRGRSSRGRPGALRRAQRLFCRLTA